MNKYFELLDNSPHTPYLYVAFILLILIFTLLYNLAMDIRLHRRMKRFEKDEPETKNTARHEGNF